MTDLVVDLRHDGVLPKAAQPPSPWPYGSMEEWRSYRASLEQQKGPYSAFLRAEANRELARIARCASEPAGLRPTIVPPKVGTGGSGYS